MRPDYLRYDPQQSGPQYLEDLATGYWFSQALFTGVQAGLFDLLAGGGKGAGEISAAMNWEVAAAGRFLDALVALGLLGYDGTIYYNTGLANRCLVKGSKDYQGDSILWRQELMKSWQGLTACLQAGGRIDYPRDNDQKLLLARTRSYIRAMDNVARSKAKEILSLCAPVLRLGRKGRILDLGAGSGAFSAVFLENAPGWQATLVDLPTVLPVTREILTDRGLAERITFYPSNLLDQDSLPQGEFDLVILSNIIHAYSEKEIQGILAQAASRLAEGGLLLVHDFFPEHDPGKARLLDLNMLINTYNGQIFGSSWVGERLNSVGLDTTGLIPLASDTALIIGAKRNDTLLRLGLDPVSRLASAVKKAGFSAVGRIATDQVEVAEWTALRCRFGCPNYGKPNCPPNTPTPSQTRRVLREFRTALLLEGEPPGKEFQRRVLAAERTAFKAGFYKAFAFWAGACALCDQCVGTGPCRRPADGRPSMEASGIDVFATVRKAGFSLQTLTDKNDFVKYYALLLLE